MAGAKRISNSFLGKLSQKLDKAFGGGKKPVKNLLEGNDAFKGKGQKGFNKGGMVTYKDAGMTKSTGKVSTGIKRY